DGDHTLIGIRDAVELIGDVLFMSIEQPYVQNSLEACEAGAAMQRNNFHTSYIENFWDQDGQLIGRKEHSLGFSIFGFSKIFTDAKRLRRAASHWRAADVIEEWVEGRLLPGAAPNPRELSEAARK